MREHFLLDPAVTFLNHGSFGACPKPVFDALQRWQLEMERNPVEFLGRRSASLLASARERLASFVGAAPDDLAFVPNATTGVNIVARSFALAPGDEVLATDHEYGACVTTFRRVCDARGATYRAVPVPLPFEPDRFAEQLLAAAGPRTKLIFVSHITSTTALIFPLAELCRRARERGIATLVDGAHAPGHVALDIAAIGADFYTGNCHKWMCAPKGAGFLHVRPEHQASIDAPVTSWGYTAEISGHTGFDAYTGRTPLERRLLWQGTRDIAAWLSVPAAIDFLATHDAVGWRPRCHEAAVALRERVRDRNGLPAPAPASSHGQMVIIPVRSRDAEGLRRRLFDRHRIEVPVTQHGDQVFVRVSVQCYNDAADLAALEAALEEAGV